MAKILCEPPQLRHLCRIERKMWRLPSIRQAILKGANSHARRLRQSRTGMSASAIRMSCVTTKSISQLKAADMKP